MGILACKGAITPVCTVDKGAAVSVWIILQQEASGKVQGHWHMLVLGSGGPCNGHFAQCPFMHIVLAYMAFCVLHVAGCRDRVNITLTRLAKYVQDQLLASIVCIGTAHKHRLS